MAIEKNGTPNGNLVETHMFTCSTGDTNHNKFWECKLYDSDDVHIRFGRIGVTETNGVHRGVGRAFMEKKMREKEKGKVNKATGEREPYTEISVLDGEGTSVQSNGSNTLKKSELKIIATSQIEHTSKATKDLIEWLADVNRHAITDLTGGQIKFDTSSGMFTTPLGIVPPSSIALARDLLIKISNYVVKEDFDNKTFKDHVEEYLTYIPHNLGMKWNPQSFLPDLNAVQKENGILDALDASYVTATTQDDDEDKKKKDEKPKVFETKLIEVTSKKIIKDVDKLFRKTSNTMHRDVYNMKVHSVWDVDIKPMTEAFEIVSKKIGNVMDLWHGTQAANLLSILKVGLVIPPSNSSHCTGRMFGDGVYASDQSTKALNYATSFWGGKDVGRYFMFIVQFAMGRMYRPSGYGSRKPNRKDYDSTFAEAGKSGVRNNEMIVFDTKQVCLKKLVEFRR